MARTYTFSQEGLAARSAQKDASRLALMDAARELFAQKGYDGVSVTEIGRAAGVSHSLINTRFGGKAGLLYELIQELNAPQLDRTIAVAEGDAPPLDRLGRIIALWTEADLADRRVLRVLQAHTWQFSDAEEAANRQVRQSYLDCVLRLVAEARTRGDLPTGESPDWLGEAIFGLYTWGLRDAAFRDLSAEDAADRILSQIIALVRGT